MTYRFMGICSAIRTRGDPVPRTDGNALAGRQHSRGAWV